jgi:hypothetical protein
MILLALAALIVVSVTTVYVAKTIRMMWITNRYIVDSFERWVLTPYMVLVTLMMWGMVAALTDAALISSGFVSA